jgi:hypothetical protein
VRRRREALKCSEPRLLAKREGDGQLVDPNQFTAMYNFGYSTSCLDDTLNVKFFSKKESAAMNYTRLLAATALAGVLLMAPGRYAGAAPVSSAGLSRIDGLSAIEFVQAKPKPETMKHKVKRIWRNLTGYKFDVACPVFPFALTRTSCTETGKNREDARAKCQSQHVFCEVKDAR